MQKLKKTRRKHKLKNKIKIKKKEKEKNTERNINLKKRKKKKKHIKTLRKTKKNINTVFPAHEPPRKINISKGLAGIFLFVLCLLLCFPSSCYVFVVFVCVV